MALIALSDVRTKIDIIFLAEFKAQAATVSRKNIPVPELAHARSDFTNSPKSDGTEPSWQGQPVFELRCKHVSVQVLESDVAPQLVVSPIDAFAIKRWATRSGARVNVVGEDLLWTQTAIVIESESVRLK
jgi:hypothetical protein